MAGSREVQQCMYDHAISQRRIQHEKLAVKREAARTSGMRPICTHRPHRHRARPNVQPRRPVSNAKFNVSLDLSVIAIGMSAVRTCAVSSQQPHESQHDHLLTCVQVPLAVLPQPTAFSSQKNERSTTQRLGITANLGDTLRLATSVAAPKSARTCCAKRSPESPLSINTLTTSDNVSALRSHCAAIAALHPPGHSRLPWSPQWQAAVHSCPLPDAA